MSLNALPARCALLLLGLLSSAAPTAAQDSAEPVIHSLCDLSQSFSFYIDGRFARQYLGGQERDVRNWGTLAKADLSRTNLVVLTGGEAPIPYSRATVDHLVEYVREGGGLLVMADGAEATQQVPVPVPVAALLDRFDLELGLERTKRQTVGHGLPANVEITYRGGRALIPGDGWTNLVSDIDQKPILARRDFGRGQVLVGSRGLFGQRPDASDPINAEWITPLLKRAVSGKRVDPKLRQPRLWAELTEQVGPLTLEFTEGTAPFARAIATEYAAIKPHLRDELGVDLAPGMISNMLILPTGGGGFSSGNRIAIGAFWGNFPERRYPMLELISHEATHSWVLPHPEPLWNEPIATYLGIRIGQRLKLDEATRTLERQIADARRLDPELDAINPLAADAPREVIWGKSYFVFEELERLHGPGALAKYFQAKRRLVPNDHPRYTMDDCVAVWSAAVDRDLFEWFRELAFDVSRERSGLALPTPSK